jgi:RHS repeat-associated protein
MSGWSVSEPEISLWLQDTPMTYKTSTGKEFPLKFYYYQRETRPIGTNIFNFGPNWNCNWLSYLDVGSDAYYNYTGYPDTNFIAFGAILYGSGGGQLSFAADPSDYSEEFGANEYYPEGTQGAVGLAGYLIGPWQGSDVTPQYQTHTTLHNDLITNVVAGVTNMIQNGFQENYPNGSVATYGLQYVITGFPYPPESLFFLTTRTDPQGRTTQFFYNTNNNMVLLSQVIDWDGNTNTIKYNDSLFSNQVTEVDGPYGSVYLKYDTNGMLTNLTDVAGMSSSFQYTFTNDYIPELITLTTPYGNTYFNYYLPTASLIPDSQLDRAIQVTEPDGGTHLFAYWQLANTGSPNPPVYYPDKLTGIPVDDYTNSDPYTNGICDDYMQWHNSFYWGPRQYALLSTTNILALTTNDYNLARMRNWLDEPTGGTVSDTLSMEQLPSPDGITLGQMIWYGYDGKTSGDQYGAGTNAFPSYIARVLPNGQTAYTYQQYNALGYPILNVSTYSIGNTVALRTNIYLYAANNIDLLQIIGPDGVTNVSYGYNTLHQLVAETNALREVTRYTYASFANSYSTNSQLTSIIYPSGLVTTNIYNSSGFLITNCDYALVGGSPVYYRTNSYTYTDGNVYTHTDERGLTVTNTWDALNRLLKINFPDGTGITNTYHYLDLAQTVDRMGFVNSFSYDNMRRMLYWTNALGKVTSYTYCTCGSLESITDPLSDTTTFSYDNQGRRTQIAYPSSTYTIDYNYDSIGNITNITDSSGASFTNLYNNQGLVYAVSNAAGQIVDLTYDIDDRITNLVNPNNVSLGIAYDSLWRPLSVTYPDTGVEHWGYTSNVFDITSYTNQIGNIVTCAYDAMGRQTNEVFTGVTTNSVTYDGASDLLTLTDGKHQTTTWNYDQYGNVTNKVDAAGNTAFAYKYDADNRLTNRWTPAKTNTAYSYDSAGNLIHVTYPVSPAISLSYDALNRLTNMVDSVGTTHYTYDQVGQLMSEGGLWPNDAVSYTYTNRLRTSLSLQAPSGSAWTQSYGYDLSRRLTSVGSPAGTFGYIYDPVKLLRVTSLNFPNGVYITNTYDSVARMLSTRLLNSSSSILDSESYAYNQAGQLTAETNTAGDFRNYTYDNEGELTTAFGKEAGGTTNRWQEQFGYTYDGAGNLNYRTNNALLQAFTVNNLNELSNATYSGMLTVAGTTTSPATNVTVNTSNAVLYADSTFASTNQPLVNGSNTFTAVAKDIYGRINTNSVTAYLPATNAYSYDGNGNLTNDGTRNFAYDDENQLTSVWVANVWSNNFVYDGKLRRRIERDYSWNSSVWTETNEIHFIYDRNVVIQERNASNNPQVTYTRGNDLSGTLQGTGGIGGLLARTDYGQEIPGTPTTAYYHADGNGNITMLIYTNQIIAAKYLYDPYGKTLSLSGPLASLNVYLFSSKEWNNTTGLYYYLYRHYDPNLQRWLNRDPIQELGGLNLYNYVGNSPVDFVDPYGLTIGGAVVGGGIGGVVGAYTGGIIGGAIGGLGGLVGGGAGGTAVEPGGGTAVGAISGTAAGSAAGASVGADIGAGIGTGVGAWLGDLISNMARNESGQRNYINDIADQKARESGGQKTPCDILNEMMNKAKCEGNTKKQQEIQQAQKAAGCRNVRKR